MSTYKLTYFTPRALAEASRLVLVYSGQQFEDIRLSHDEFPLYKDSFPFGQVPLLEIDNGKQLAQSGAIVRYLAKKFNLNGSCDWEAAKAEEIWFFFYDNLRAQHDYNAVRLGHGKPGADVEKLHKEVFLPIVQKVLPVYYKLVKSSQSGFLLPSGVSYADFTVAEHILTIFSMDTSLSKQYPELLEFKNKIHSLPQIADYVKSRPQTIV